MTTYTAYIWDDTFKIRADWSNASSSVQRLSEYGEWEPTGKQVADYAHRPAAAMRDHLSEVVRAGGDNPDDEVILLAITVAAGHMVAA